MTTRRKRMRVRATSMMMMKTTPHLAWRARRSLVRRACRGTRWRGRPRKRTARLQPGGSARRLHRRHPPTSAGLNRPDADDSDIDELLYDLRDTITHELNHMYEFYNRILNTGSSEFSLAKSFAGGRNVNTPKKIFKVYAKFLDYLYYSEPWEINANIQEAYSKLLRMSWEEFKNGKQYKIADAMENYSGEQMFDELYNATMERSPEAVLFHIKNLHKFYLKQYLQFVKSERGDDITSEEELMKDEVFKTRNILELFKKFETRINNAGTKLKRNYARLNAIERND
jgi:hypothetical protein